MNQLVLSTPPGRTVAECIRNTIERTQHIKVRRIASDADLKSVLRLRYTTGTGFDEPDAAFDDLDLAKHSIILVAEHKNHGIVGTLRLTDGRDHVELDNYLILGLIPMFSDRSFVEATRLAVTRCDETQAVKLMLFKAYWLYAQELRRKFLLISATQRFSNFYGALGFQDIGIMGAYRHSVRRNVVHRTFFCDLQEMVTQHSADKNPILNFVLEQEGAFSF